MALILFGTSACHLCEEAQALLMQYQGLLNDNLYLDDIAESDELVARYGIRIPVLRHEGSGAELDWPFTGPELTQFLQQCGCLVTQIREYPEG